MNALYIMIPISVLLGSVFIAIFILAAKDDQFEDLTTPAYRILTDDINEIERGNE